MAVSLLLLLLTISSLFLSFSFANGSFTVDLFRRDSPLSPYYNSSQTPQDKLHASHHRSLARAEHFRTSLAAAGNGDHSIVSTVTPNQNDFLMSLSIGTPPFKILAIADTGSDLTWTQCKPCTNCYKQIAPLFDPSGSSTYKALPCGSDSCGELNIKMCDKDKNCRYDYSYGDGSHTDGVLSTETLTFSTTTGQPVKVPNIVFGCSHDSDGTFDEHVAGLVGLDRGPLSLVSQLGDNIDNKFSYCLVPFTATKSSSRLTFGRAATSSGPNVVSTPIYQDTFYSLNLESIIVGNIEVPVAVQTGNIIIDSGTTFTMLSATVLDAVSTAVRKLVTLKPARDPQEIFEVCFHSAAAPSMRGMPDVVFQFEGNATVTLPPVNTFAVTGEGILCLAMVPSETAIFGNLAQQNFLVEYDIGAQKLSFAPRDCTKL